MTDLVTPESLDAAVVTPERRWPLGLVRTVSLLLTLCFAAGVLGWAIARDADHDDTRHLNAVDIGFLTDMTIHHNGAITLAFTYLAHEHDEAVGHFARDIVVGQSGEIVSMNGMLGTAGPATASGKVMGWMGHPFPVTQMPGMPTAAELARLKTATGLDADEQFTRLMILHHAAGVDMAEYAARYGSDPQVKEFAASMAKVQRYEIDQMNARRQALGLSTVDTAVSTNGVATRPG